MKRQFCRATVHVNNRQKTRHLRSTSISGLKTMDTSVVHGYPLLGLLNGSLFSLSLLYSRHSQMHTHTHTSAHRFTSDTSSGEAFCIWRRPNSLGWLSEKRLWPQIMKHIIGPAFTLSRERRSVFVCLPVSVSVCLPVWGTLFIYFSSFLFKSRIEM